MKLFIPKVPPSLNTVLRQHWSGRGKERDQWRRLLRAKYNGEGPFSRVKITRICPSRGLDPDNLAGGCKMLVDAMTREGYITDDDALSVKIEYAQKRPETGQEKGVVLEFWK